MSRNLLVTVTSVNNINVGDTIWAHDDGDWFLVKEIQYDEDGGEFRFLRHDGSQATFEEHHNCLKRVEPSHGRRS